MIQFDSFVLDNGLRVLVHEDPSVQIAVLNVLYDVGSRDEDPNRTGFAHLFEHLMFGGSANIPNYDAPLQMAGGENNAFTSTDITNYYLTVPASNIETGFWLESDRMMALSFNSTALEVQRKVVIEEFKQRYLNQPYGDVWLKLRPLAYHVHPYQWATIGKEISHIEQATLTDVKDFFYSHYLPNNAILVVAGKVKLEQVKRLSEKWFGPIPARSIKPRNLPKEPKQTQKRTFSVSAKVPASALYKAWHMPGRTHADYYAYDMTSDVLSRGQSSRLYQSLVKEKEIFTSLSCYVTGTIDPGLFVVSGRIKPGITLIQAEEEVDAVLQQLKREGPTADELIKIKNQAASAHAFGNVEVINRAMNLAQSAWLGNPDLVNTELALINQVTREDVMRVTNTVWQEENASVLYYEAQKK
jgi:zinc protease